MAMHQHNLRQTVYRWLHQVGVRLSSSQLLQGEDMRVNHYFFKTFNIMEVIPRKLPNQPVFWCFDTYGEKMDVDCLLDLQTAFYENLSELK